LTNDSNNRHRGTTHARTVGVHEFLNVRAGAIRVVGERLLPDLFGVSVRPSGRCRRPHLPPASRTEVCRRVLLRLRPTSAPADHRSNVEAVVRKDAGPHSADVACRPDHRPILRYLFAISCGAPGLGAAEGRRPRPLQDQDEGAVGAAGWVSAWEPTSAVTVVAGIEAQQEHARRAGGRRVQGGHRNSASGGRDDPCDAFAVAGFMTRCEARRGYGCPSWRCWSNPTTKRL